MFGDDLIADNGMHCRETSMRVSGRLLFPEFSRYDNLSIKPY